MLLALLVACATAHRGADGVTFDITASAYDARLLLDAEMAAEALENADGDVPVSVTTSVRAPGGRSSSTTVTKGMPGIPVYASGIDPRLAQAAAYTAAYRAAVTNGAVSGGVTYQSATVTLGSVTVTAQDLATACPSMGKNGRAPTNAAEYLACQAAFDRSIRAAAVEVR